MLPFYRFFVFEGGREGFVEMIKKIKLDEKTGCMFYQLVGEICSVNKIMRERW